MVHCKLRIGSVFTSALVLFAVITGCSDPGPKLAPVKGTIKFKGTPVAQGSIMFQPENGPAATSEIKDGSYVLKTIRDGDGAVLGKHKVVIISLQDQSNRLPEDRSPFPEPLIPLKYNFSDKSGLTGLVEEKQNIIDFDLK